MRILFQNPALTACTMTKSSPGSGNTEGVCLKRELLNLVSAEQATAYSQVGFFWKRLTLCFLNSSCPFLFHQHLVSSKKRHPLPCVKISDCLFPASWALVHRYRRHPCKFIPRSTSCYFSAKMSEGAIFSITSLFVTPFPSSSLVSFYLDIVLHFPHWCWQFNFKSFW